MTAYVSIESWESADGLSSAEISVYYADGEGPLMIDLDYEFSAGMLDYDARSLARKLIEAADFAKAHERVRA